MLMKHMGVCMSKSTLNTQLHGERGVVKGPCYPSVLLVKSEYASSGLNLFFFFGSAVRISIWLLVYTFIQEKICFSFPSLCSSATDKK